MTRGPAYLSPRGSTTYGNLLRLAGVPREDSAPPGGEVA
jgi:hypothetical protein